MYALTLDVHRTGAIRIWLRKRHAPLKVPTLQIAPSRWEYVENSIASLSDYYPKRQVPTWTVRTYIPHPTMPTWYRISVRHGVLFRGPHLPGALLPWDEAYELWLAHVRMAVTERG